MVWPSPPGGSNGCPSGPLATLGVVLFFLLSGYVIGNAYPSERHLFPGVYVLKRFIRIWPIFAVSIFRWVGSALFELRIQPRIRRWALAWVGS